MQNPSQGVHQSLQAHVHLISAHRFPLSATLNVDQAYRYLLDAPSIVKQIAPMAWHYVSAPQDGTMWLEWLPLEKNDQPFPSDGYVWGDPEQTYRQDYQGYIIEGRVHQLGYRPGQDQMACHARTRYHFVSKNPSVAAPPPDPSLWIVHYHAANPNQMLPAQSMPVSPQMQQIVTQRRWLESQGQLDRRDFMLHDREHWPTLSLPGQMQRQYGAMPVVQNRFPQQHYPQQAGGPPAAKKARTSGPSMSMPGVADPQHETTIEIEEDTALGDFFDHLTQRDISVARYTQHHRWMEEVFSSPYATNQIVPADLGLGLMGELKGLTDGILELPNADLGERAERPAKAKDADPFTNLKKEQVEEFGKRVEKHIQEGHSEIERMQAEHAAKMQGWKKVKALNQAEKRLRYATWEGDADAVHSYRLEEPIVNGHADQVGQETVEDVMREVEEMLKVKIASHEDATRIARGGLQDRKQPAFDYDQQPNEQETLSRIDAGQQRSNSLGISTPGANGSVSGPPTFHEDPTAATRNAGDQVTSKQPTPAFNLAENSSTPNPMASDQQDSVSGEVLGDLPGMDMNDTLMDGMDIDVGDNDLNFDEATHGLDTDTPTSLQPEAQTSGAEATSSAPAPAVTADTLGETSQNAVEPEQAQKDQPQPGATDEAAMAGDSGPDGAHDTGSATMFNDDDGTFEGLGNIDDHGDDTLIDFDGGDMGLDDTAFGDALHGMDDPEGAGGS